MASKHSLFTNRFKRRVTQGPQEAPRAGAAQRVRTPVMLCLWEVELSLVSGPVLGRGRQARSDGDASAQEGRLHAGQSASGRISQLWEGVAPYIKASKYRK